MKASAEPMTPSPSSVTLTVEGRRNRNAQL
jgi:hypothetical protein